MATDLHGVGSQILEQNIPFGHWAPQPTSHAFTTAGAWCFIREWGRIGRAGQTRTVPYPTPQEAQAALERQRRAKERRGYTQGFFGLGVRS